MRGGFTVKVYKAEEGGYWAEVPELPGCVTQSQTLSGIRENIGEAIEGYLETLAERAHPKRSPAPSRAVKTFRIELAAV